MKINNFNSFYQHLRYYDTQLCLRLFLLCIRHFVESREEEKKSEFLHSFYRRMKYNEIRNT